MDRHDPVEMTATSQSESAAEKQSQRLRAVKSRDTRPEVRVRRAAHAMGLRFRLHRRDLPGSPDIVFPRWKTVILVHGCFWHRHGCRLGQKMPGSNIGYWERKFRRTLERDRENIEALQALGWRVAVIWECETKREEVLRLRLESLFATQEQNTSTVFNNRTP